jgi:hypothetical protein
MMGRLALGIFSNAMSQSLGARSILTRDCLMKRNTEFHCIVDTTRWTSPANDGDGCCVLMEP